MESQQWLSRNSKSARSSNTTREARPTLGPPVIIRSCACCHRKKPVREHTVSRATPSLSSGAPRNTKSSQSTLQPLSGPQQRSCHDRGHEHLPFQWHIAILQYRRGTYKRLRRRYVTLIVRVSRCYVRRLCREIMIGGLRRMGRRPVFVDEIEFQRLRRQPLELPTEPALYSG
jgi:hypothetical protein